MLGYLFLILFLFVCWLCSQIQPQYKKIFSCIFCVFFILFVGLRYEVGRDYDSYKEIFEYKYDLSEVGYNFLSSLIRNVDGNFIALMLLCSFISVLLLHHVFSRYRYYYISFLLFIIMSGGYSFMVNGIRQAIACCFFFMAVYNICSLKRYIFFVSCAICFHMSAVILVPFYWICKLPFNGKTAFKVILLLLILSKFVDFGNMFVPFIKYSVYEKYFAIIDTFNTNAGTGLGFLFINVIGLIVLYRSDLLLNKHPGIKQFMWMFFCFFFFRILFEKIAIFLRIALYFDYSLYIIIPYFIFSCISKKSKTLIFFSLILLLLVLFVKSVNDTNFMLEYKTVLTL